MACKVAQLKKTLSAIPGPNRKDKDGSVHARVERGPGGGRKSSNPIKQAPPGRPNSFVRKHGSTGQADRVVLRDMTNSLSSHASGKDSSPPVNLRKSHKGKELAVVISPSSGGDRRFTPPKASRWHSSDDSMVIDVLQSSGSAPNAVLRKAAESAEAGPSDHPQ